MDINAITQLISTVGFPIAACCALFWQADKSDKRHQVQLDKMAEQHREEMEKVTTALNNNTVALTELSARITGGDKNG